MVTFQALLRPGRFDQLLYVPLPDANTREEIFRIEFLVKPVHKDVKISDLVEKTNGYSGAEVTAICQKAAVLALTRCGGFTKILLEDFEKALSTIKPRTKKSSIKIYEDFAENRYT